MIPIQDHQNQKRTCLGLSMLLHQTIEHIALGIYCSPQVILFSFDGDNDFIEMPFIRELRTFAPHLIRVLLSKLLAPFSD